MKNEKNELCNIATKRSIKYSPIIADLNFDDKVKRKSIFVTMADSRWFDQARQTLSSAFFKGKWKGDMMILAHEPSPDVKWTDGQLKWFTDRNIIVTKTKPLFYKNDYWGSNVFAKYLLYTKEFKKWDNVVYVDCDVIVTNDINCMANVDGYYGAYTQTFGKQFDRSVDSTVYDELMSKFDKNLDTFNAGILVFSTNIIKDDTYTDIIELTHKYLHIANCSDEAIYNIYFYDKWKLLSSKYNLMPHVCGTKGYNDDKKGIMLHFCGHNKPWINGSPFHDEYYKEWVENLAVSDDVHINNSYKHKQDDVLLIDNGYKKKNDLLVLYASNDNIYRCKQLIDNIKLKGKWDGGIMVISHNVSKHNEKHFINKDIIVKSCKYPDKQRCIVCDDFISDLNNIIYIDDTIDVKGDINVLKKSRGFLAISAQHPSFSCDNDCDFITNKLNVTPINANDVIGFIDNSESELDKKLGISDKYFAIHKYNGKHPVTLLFSKDKIKLSKFYRICDDKQRS